MECKNCGTEYEGNFCPNCGQRKDIPSISIKGLFMELIYAFDFERGLLHTLKTLTTQPGQTIREYIDGKRKPHISPFRYLLLMSAIGATLIIFVPLDEIMMSGMEVDAEDLEFQEKSRIEISSIQKSYYTVVNLFSLPFGAVLTSLFFFGKKKGFGEHLLANTYITAHSSWVFFISIIPFLFIEAKTYYTPLSLFITFVTLVYFIWGILGFIQPKNKIWAVIKVIFLYFILQIIIITAIGALAGYRIALAENAG